MAILDECFIIHILNTEQHCLLASCLIFFFNWGWGDSKNVKGILLMPQEVYVEKKNDNDVSSCCSPKLRPFTNNQGPGNAR